jgi:hypothetical protein
MSPCCLAAATATAVLTALIIVGLTAFVLVTDGLGLGLLAGTLLAVGFERLGWIGPCARLLHALSALLAVRAAWLLATTRRPLVVAVWRLVRPRASWAVRHLTPLGRLRRDRPHGHPHAGHAEGAPTVYRIGPRPE